MRLIIAALLTLAVATAQNSYNASHRWWEPNQDEQFPWDSEYDNSTGMLRVSLPDGSVRTGGHPFFKPLGENGRACITCHQPSNAMSLSVENIRLRWAETKGKDPLFAPVDGADCPGEAPTHKLLLNHGLFRVSLPWPPPQVKPEFNLEVVRDPTGCNATPGQVSVYRRPRMSANLPKLIPGPHGPMLMADGRAATLRDQALDAVMVHMEAKTEPTEADLKRILEFEIRLFAQQFSDHRGGLTAQFHEAMPGVAGEFRQAVQRGEALFQSRCATCHQAGQSRLHVIPKPELPGLPVFRATCTSGRVVTTQDPGRALITGRCEDLGATVAPQFFGLAARAPYFSNGSAPDLSSVVDTYARMGLSFTPAEKQDLIHYLQTR